MALPMVRWSRSALPLVCATVTLPLSHRYVEARAQRQRANIKDAATYMVDVGKVGEVDGLGERAAACGERPGAAEAAKRRAEHRAEAGAASARMQRRDETLTTIAELTGVGFVGVRSMLRHARKAMKHMASSGSSALGGGRQGGALLRPLMPTAARRRPARQRPDCHRPQLKAPVTHATSCRTTCEAPSSHGIEPQRSPIIPCWTGTFAYPYPRHTRHLAKNPG